MRIARLTTNGSIEEIVKEDLCPLTAELEAHKAASRHPGVLFGVIPDDAEELLSVAHTLAWLKAA